MKRILCPTDFSETADMAVVYAAQLCKRIGAGLTLLNVQTMFSLPADEVIKGKFLATEPAREKLESQCYKVADVFKIPCYSEVEASNNDLSDVIARWAKDFDLIVMGTNGVDDYHDFFFGSRSYQVAKESSIPVLLIPRGCTYQDMTTIVFAFDYELGQEILLDKVVKFSALFDASITILEVKNNYTREAEVNSEKIQDRIKLLYNLLDIQFDTSFSNEVGDSINSYMVTSKANVLALCSTHHTIVEAVFHKSVIKMISSTVNYPVFIFHEY